MASIKTAISLNDQMSAPIRNICNAMNTMISSWDDLSNRTGEGLDVDSVETIRTELHQATSALDSMNDKQEKFNENVNRGANAVDGLGKKIAGIAASIGFAKIAKDAIEFASDLTEVQNVVDVSFGANSAIVDEWSTTTLNAFGLNELSAKRYAGTMGAMLKSSGLTGDAVTDMSMKITELAGDMASFYNLEGDEAFAKIRSGISGETEPLKQLGINMSVANLEAYALSEGINKAYSEMSQAEQVTLRYNYLLSVTADAQGDFARTSNSFANQQKLLAENWKALTGQIASGILPILANLFQTLNNGIKSFSDNIETFLPILGGLVTILGLYAIAIGVSNAVTAISSIVKKVHAAATMMEAGATFKATAAQHGFNAALLACPLTWIIVLIIALIAVVIALANHFSGAGHTAQTAFGVITGGINVAVQAVKNAGLMIANVGLGIWGALGAVCSNIGTAFHNVIANVQGWWYGLLSTVLNVVAGICEALNKIPFISFDYSGLVAKADEYAAKSAEAYGSTEEYTSIADAFSEGFNTFDAFKKGWAQDAYADGAAWGDGKWDSWFSGSDSVNAMTDAVAGGFDDSAVANDIAGSAGSAAKSLETTAEDLKYLRDIAERDIINRFTTAEVKVDLGGVTNNVSSGADLDGIITYLSESVSEALQMVAEGVHA